MKQRFIFIGVLIFSTALTGCQDIKATYGLMTGKDLSALCPSQLKLKVGQSFGISFPENPSTGYQWQLAKPLTIFKMDKRYQQNQTEVDKIGTGGTANFSFTALQTGRENIQLVYIRSLEKSSSPAQQWQCTVQVVAF